MYYVYLFHEPKYISKLSIFIADCNFALHSLYHPNQVIILLAPLAAASDSLRHAFTSRLSSPSYLNLLNQLHLPWLMDQVGDKGSIGTTNSSCASTAVNVVSNVTWEIIVDHMGHLKKNIEQEQK